jgi:predicted nucleotidyltransferase
MRTVPQSFLRQPLSAVLANPANVRVLRELSRHGGELSATTLAQRSKLTKPSVLASLDHLAGLGYVEPLGTLRQRLYRIDSKHPLVPALSDLFSAEDQRFQSIIEAIRAAAIDAGATAAWLYGSVARGEDRPDSDVDVALVASGNAGSAKAKMREALRGREDTLRFSASVLGLDADDIVRLAAENDPWWVAVVEDTFPLVGPDPLSLASRLSAQKTSRRSAKKRGAA